MERNDFVQLVEAIISHLDGWTAELNTLHRAANNATLTNHSRGLSFHMIEDNGRLTIRPNYNSLAQYIPYGGKRPRITVSPKRSPQAIANDITRRFLPNFFAMMEICQDRHDRTTQAISDANANANAMITASNGLLSMYSTTRNATTVKLTAYLHSSIWITANVDAKDVDLELHNLPQDLAQFIIATVADHISQPAQPEMLQ